MLVTESLRPSIVATGQRSVDLSHQEFVNRSAAPILRSVVRDRLIKLSHMTIWAASRVYERLMDTFVFEPRGDVEIKGKGVMQTWFVVTQRDADSVVELQANQHGPGVR